VVTSLPPEEVAAAGAKLVSSRTVRTGLLWLLTAVVLPSAGWAVAKLDTQKDMAAIRLSVDRLTTQQRELLERIQTTEPRLEQRINGVQRDVALAMVAARAYESERNSKAKLEAADRIVTERYDNQIRALVPPAAAARATFEGAMPYAAR
jgi:hypothetical protein